VFRKDIKIRGESTRSYRATTWLVFKVRSASPAAAKPGDKQCTATKEVIVHAATPWITAKVSA